MSMINRVNYYYVLIVLKACAAHVKMEAGHVVLLLRINLTGRNVLTLIAHQKWPMNECERKTLQVSKFEFLKTNLKTIYLV